MLLRAAGGVSLLRAATFRQVPCGRLQIFNLPEAGRGNVPARLCVLRRAIRFELSDPLSFSLSPLER
jgi:hypothetical protein